MSAGTRNSHDRKGPTFLGIGSQRCATTFVNQVLEAHPRVRMAPKEPSFFNYNCRQKGLGWYLQLFEGSIDSVTDERVDVRGEISPNYAVMRPREVRLAHDLFPDLDLILIVRHPVDRMWSALRRHWTFSYLDGVGEIGTDEACILDYADQYLSDAFGDYRRIYKNWATVFGSDQILLLRFERLRSDPDETLARILKFVGVDPDLEWIRSYRESTSVPNRSKADVDMPAYIRYYLARRYLNRTKKFNVLTDGLVQDWVDDMEACVSEASSIWEARYQLRSTVRYRPVQWAHRLLDPVRMWWKVKRARENLPEITTDVGSVEK
ncbi:hypothetical protein GGP51_003007 [Salinibacter ruber]|uniref:sulfotransferase family protein n=1 Tax=Salinibacter ruber TaxID=146919 RepID=UPI00216781DA|nr:sulfotransferase [Salinibacter ruber]MCS4191511.1 hypothetical protein [Salinibacter ruber]